MLTTLITLSVAALACPHETSAPAPSLIQASLTSQDSSRSHIPYTYMELGYASSTLNYDGYDVDLSMLGFVGALELSPNVHIFAGGGRSIEATVDNVTVEGGQVDNWFAGIGIHQYVTPQLNGFIRVSVAGYALQADDPSINISGHDTIYTAGVRMSIWDEWEMGASVSRAPKPNIIYEFSALYRLTESLGLGMIYNKPEEGDSLSIGVRWYF